MLKIISGETLILSYSCQIERNVPYQVPLRTVVFMFLESRSALFSLLPYLIMIKIYKGRTLQYYLKYSIWAQQLLGSSYSNLLRRSSF
jgi:hypothetical protein